MAEPLPLQVTGWNISGVGHFLTLTLNTPKGPHTFSFNMHAALIIVGELLKKATEMYSAKTRQMADKIVRLENR